MSLPFVWVHSFLDSHFHQDHHLGHMRNVRGARALRRAQEAGESEAMQCAALALELGMLVSGFLPKDH